MSEVRIDLPEAARLIRNAASVLCFLHVSPDGDSIGSTLALARALEQAQQRVVMVEVDPCPRIYRFLPGAGDFTPWERVEGGFDLAVFLDCGDLHRVGAALPLVSTAQATLNIDHHLTNSVYGQYNWLDYEAASVGEMIYLLLQEMGVTLDAAMATCLYTSIVTDTGQFQYDSTSPRTHRIAGELLRAGADPYAVAQAIYESETVPRLHLLGQALGTLRCTLGGKVAVLQVTREMLAASGAGDEDVDGVVNYARKVDGVEVGVLLRETTDDQVRVNLRSRRTVDVGAVAQHFGGGGHPRAAGCTLAGTLVTAEQRLLAVLADSLGKGAAG